MMVTYRLSAYRAASRELSLCAERVRGKRKNNRAESSHVPILRRKGKMPGFRTAGSAQRILAIHAAAANTITTRRDRVSAKSRRLLEDQAFVTWQQA